MNTTIGLSTLVLLGILGWILSVKKNRDVLFGVLQAKRTYSMGIAVGLATYGIAWITNWARANEMLGNLINIGGTKVTTGALSINVIGEATSMGTANKLGVKAMAILNALIPSWAAFIQIIVGSIVLIILGRTVYSLIKFPEFDKSIPKLATELAYGALAGILIIAGVGGVGVSAMITMLIYYLILATVITFMARYWKFYSKLVQ